MVVLDRGAGEVPALLEIYSLLQGTLYGLAGVLLGLEIARGCLESVEVYSGLQGDLVIVLE